MDTKVSEGQLGIWEMDTFLILHVEERNDGGVMRCRTRMGPCRTNNYKSLFSFQASHEKCVQMVKLVNGKEFLMWLKAVLMHQQV